MTEETMVERVARALFAKEWKVESGWTFEQEMAQDTTGEMREYWFSSARAAISAMQMVWMPISTAPQDGTLVLFATRSGGVYIAPALPEAQPSTAEKAAIFHDGNSWPSAEFMPILWMPIPAPDIDRALTEPTNKAEGK